MPLLLLTLLGAALRFYGLGHQGFWYDEAYTDVLVKLPFGRMLGQLPHQESTPPLYYCLAWIWTRAFGPGQAGLRSFSAACGTAAIPLAALTSRRFLRDRRAALIVAALTAFNPLLIWYSQEARAYALLVLLSACSLLAFAHARERPRARPLALWALAAVAALCTHYYAVLIVAPEAAWLLFEHRARRGAWVSVGCVAIVGFALLPLLIAQNQTGNNAWIGRSPLGERLTQVIPLFLLGPQTPARVALKFLAFALALTALLLLARGSRTPRPGRGPSGAAEPWGTPAADPLESAGGGGRAALLVAPARSVPLPAGVVEARRGALLPAGLVVAGVVLSLLMIPASDTFLARNLLALWLPAALVIGAGFASVRARPLAGALTAALCAIGVTAAVGVASSHDLQRPNWQPVARRLGAPARGGRLVLVLRNPGIEPLGLYMPGLEHVYKVSRSGTVRVGEIDVISVRDIRGLGGFCWWGSACNLSPSILRRHYRLHGFRQVLWAQVEQFRMVKLVSALPRMVTLGKLAQLLHRPVVPSDALLIQP